MHEFPRRIAILHVALKLVARKRNLEKIRHYVAEAKSRGASLVLLPSMFSVGPIFDYYTGQTRLSKLLRNSAEKIPGPVTDYLAGLAMEYGVHIIGGPIPERAGPRVFLSSFTISPRGIILSKHRKTILDSTDYGIAYGRENTVLNLGLRIAVITEAEIMVPEVARILALNGAEVFLMFPRISHRYSEVRSLAVARSLENNVPTIVVGGGVIQRGEKIYEIPSLVVSSEGKSRVLAEGDDRVVVYDISNLVEGSSGRIRGLRDDVSRLTKNYCKMMRKISLGL